MNILSKLKNFAKDKHLGHLLIFAVCMTLFADLFWLDGTTVFGDHTRDSSADLFHEFLHLRKFGFGELLQGHIALWNPHVFSGAPFFGTFQPALFYPPNWIFLVLPLSTSINVSIAIHVYLMGAFTNCWALRRGLHPSAAALTGVLAMLSGPFYLHIYAGHLSNLCSMAWIPAIFICIDEILKPSSYSEKNLRHLVNWALAGSCMASMQLLSGHPQYFYYTGITGAVYCSLRLLEHSNIFKTAMLLMSIPVFAILLSAVQLLPGLQSNSETLRSAPLTLHYASMFSLTPESLLTIFSPWILGKLAPSQYFGRWYLWEMSLFIGVTGFVLALSGISYSIRTYFRSDKNKMLHAAPAITLLLLFLFAFGSNTFVFDFLFNHLPGYNRFRGTAKFGIFICLFLSLFAGIAFDQYLKSRDSYIFELFATSLLSVLSFGLLGLTAKIDWIAVIQTIYSTSQTFFSADLFGDNGYSQRLLLFSNFAHYMFDLSLFKVALTSIILCILFLALRKTPHAVWLIGFLMFTEIFLFAWQATERMEIRDENSQLVSNFIREHPGDYRIANNSNPSSAMSINASDISGNDPSIILRYAEFMAFVQGKSPEHPTQFLGRILPHRMLSLLRLKYIFNFLNSDTLQVITNENSIQHFTLVSNFKVVTGRNAIFSELAKNDFEPGKLVILESRPIPTPASDPVGNVRLLSETTDEMVVEVNVDRPTILLISDTYSRYWRAISLQGSIQQEYTVQPADYVIRAIPLTKGHHMIKLEYWLPSVISGFVISVFSWLLLLLYFMLTFIRSTKRSRNARLLLT